MNEAGMRFWVRTGSWQYSVDFILLTVMESYLVHEGFRNCRAKPPGWSRWQSLTEEEKELYLKKSEKISKRQSKMSAAWFMKIIML